MSDKSIPTTIASWKVDASSPRCLGGEISEIYTGHITDAPPMASPPMNLKAIKMPIVGARPQPAAG